MTAAADPHVVVDRVHMAYGRRVVFQSLSCDFPRGLVSVILGGSGSGKSTLLRMISGLVRPQTGRILVDGEDMTQLSERKLFEARHDFGMMFQGGALLDSFTVFDNLALPLREHTKKARDEITDDVHRALEAVGLKDVDNLLPRQLSGGMVKRVALARALVRRPKILLCDEPFSGLDPASTRKIESLIHGVNEQFKVTMVVVSHHIASTLRMADKIVMILPWGVVQGTSLELRESVDTRIAAFLNEEGDEAPLFHDRSPTQTPRRWRRP
ncbi:MAG: ABC transporter ATP-binding protein [Candidatus Binatia bacterium]